MLSKVTIKGRRNKKYGLPKIDGRAKVMKMGPGPSQPKFATSGPTDVASDAPPPTPTESDDSDTSVASGGETPAYIFENEMVERLWEVFEDFIVIALICLFALAVTLTTCALCAYYFSWWTGLIEEAFPLISSLW